MQKKHWGYKGFLLAMITMLVISLTGCSSSANKGTEVTPQNVEKQAAAAATSQMAGRPLLLRELHSPSSRGNTQPRATERTARSRLKRNSPRPQSKTLRC